MSWLFGYFGSTNQKQFTPPETPHYSFKDSNLVFFAGGYKRTCFFGSELNDSCWAVVGVGLKSFENSYKVLSQKEWRDYLAASEVNFNSVNGHFVALKYSNGELKFFTDELGLREIYILKLNDSFGFTTRIDWLKYFIKPEIDLKEFATGWLLQNQISRNSVIKNVTRIVCANATIKNNSLSIKQNIWQPDLELKCNKELFDSALNKILSVRDKKISLSLSGGLDSRLLLSFLIRKNSDLWDTHTFGDPNHPDSKIAFELLKIYDKKNEIIDDEIPATDKLIELVKKYSVQTRFTNPASSILNLRFYERLSDGNRIIVDGGFGEIWRRAFANKLLLAGKKALFKKDSKTVQRFLRFHRADIFSEEALAEMEKGILEQFDNLFEEMPDANQIGPEKWIDLFSIRSRLANYYAPEQARIDRFAISFMPLVQKDVLNLLFGINESEKINGKMFKQLISRNTNQLTKIPLVKGNITHPFGSSSISTRLRSRIKNKIGLSYQSTPQIHFQNSIKEFIADIINSSEVRDYEYYDRKKIIKLGNDFLLRKTNYNSEIDWFLSFELFRQGILK